MFSVPGALHAIPDRVRRLITSGLEIKVGDLAIPGLFFADDIVDIGQGVGDLKNTYLGIWFSGVKGMFNTHVENAIKKAKQLKGVIRKKLQTHTKGQE